MRGLPLKDERSHEIIHYKKYHSLKCIIQDRKPNIIIHGASNSGKTFLIEYIFRIIFGKNRLLTEDKVSFQYNLNYYVFNFSDNLKHILMKKIKSIIKSHNHFNDTIKYIVIDNYNNIPDVIQKNIKVFMEKYYRNSRFILITNKLFSIDASTRSNCFNIKIDEPTKYDKYIYFKYLLEKYNVNYNPFLLFKNCEKYSIDHITNLYYDNVKYCSIYERIDNTIHQIMNTTFNLTKIK